MRCRVRAADRGRCGNAPPAIGIGIGTGIRTKPLPPLAMLVAVVAVPGGGGSGGVRDPDCDTDRRDSDRDPGRDRDMTPLPDRRRRGGSNTGLVAGTGWGAVGDGMGDKALGASRCSVLASAANEALARRAMARLCRRDGRDGGRSEAGVAAPTASTACEGTTSGKDWTQ